MSALHTFLSARFRYNPYLQKRLLFALWAKLAFACIVSFNPHNNTLKKCYLPYTVGNNEV